LKIVKIPVGAVAIDFLGPPSEVEVEAFSMFTLPGTQTRFTFAIRYLENLTPEECDWWLSRGMGLAVVGESRANGWTPSAGAGSADGMREVARARALNLPSGSQLWCDLEEPINTHTPMMLSDYGHAQCDVITRSGFVPSAYIGSGLNASPNELLALPYLGYWHSLSEVQNVIIGFEMVQLYPTMTLLLSTGERAVDLDIVQQDKRGRQPTMIVRD
jgi:Domain of unknown function (DUF1906)